MEQDLFHQGQQIEYKKAIIVGASSGMGKELCRILIKKGYSVGITGRRENLLEELKAETPDRIYYRAFDIRDMSKTSKGLRELIRELGGLDLLVLSSGTGFLNEELDSEPEFRTIDTNVTAFTDIMTFGYRYFQMHPPGHLVGITSIGGLRGNALAPAYNASKAYQSNYLEALRLKSRKSGNNIRITDIRPGFVDTDMAKGDKLFWVATPNKAASLIYRAIRHKKRVAYISRRWRLFALMLKLLPRRLYEKL
ncbi:SDR family NAD(P)-dependent oxidoreductase [Bacteroidota bacterium]